MSHTVLICDDAIFMRTMVGDILQQAGFEIVGEAETGAQAVEKYRAAQARPRHDGHRDARHGRHRCGARDLQARSRREGPDVQRDGTAGAGGRGDPGRRQGLRGEAVPAGRVLEAVQRVLG